MARTDTEQLVVSLEARVRDFEKGMQKAAGTADKQFGKMNRSAKASAATLESTMKQAASRVNGALGKIGLGGIAGLGIAGIVSGIGDVAKGVADIGRSAKQAGMDSRSFQELAYVARANRIEVDSLTAGMRELSLRGSEFFTTGKGSAAEAFKALGYSAADVHEKLKQPSAFLTEIIGKVQALDKASQIAIFDKLFGGNGERFVQLIDRGADGIRDTIQEAHTLNAVLSDDVIESAAELDRKFNAVATTVGTSLKRAIVEAATALQDFIDRFNGFEDQRTSSLDSQLSELGRERLDLERRMGELRSGGRAGDGLFGTSFGESTADDAIRDTERRMEAIAAEEQMILKVLEARRKLQKPAPDVTPAAPYVPPEDKDGAAKRDKAAAAAEREADAVRRLIAELEHEYSLLGMSEEQRRAAEISWKAGTAAKDEDRKKLIALNEAIYQHQAAMDAAKEAAEGWNDAMSAGFDMVGDALGSIIDGSVRAEDAVKKLAVQLAIAAAQGALLGEGPLAGLFGKGSGGGAGIGSLFAKLIPGFAGGTNSAPGGLAVVGERGPELVNLPKGSQVFPKVPKALPASGGNVTSISMPIEINAPGADAAALERVRAEVKMLAQKVPSMAVNAVQTARKRNVRM